MCPLKAASRLSSVLPGLRGLADDTTIERLAANPMTLGGALMLMSAPSAESAGDLQKRVCNTLLYPKFECKWAAGGDLGPLYYHLEGSQVGTGC